MYLPNPIAFFAVKALTYSGLGGLVRVRATRPGNPVIFGLGRAAMGWIVGLPVLLVAGVVVPDGGDAAVIGLLAIPRLVLSALLVQTFFRPRGGYWETAAWATFSVALASAIDWLLLTHVNQVEWVRIPWC